MEKTKENNPGSVRESLFRFAMFIVVFILSTGVLVYGLTHNPKLVFPEGFGFVVGASVLFGLLTVAEGCSLLWRLKKHLFG